MHDRTQCRTQAIKHFYIDTNPNGHPISLSTSSADQHTTPNLDAAADLDTAAVFYSICYLDAFDHTNTVQYAHLNQHIVADQYSNPANENQHAYRQQYTLAVTHKSAASNKDAYTSVDKNTHTDTDLDAQVWI